MTRKPLSVAVFNDSPTLRAAIRAALATAPDLVLAVERPSGRDAAGVVERAQVDVVVMDVVMPEVDGFQATRDIMARRPTPILMVSSVIDPRDRTNILAALQAGALHIAEAPPAPGAPDHARRASAFVELLRTIAGANLRSPDPGSATPPRHRLTAPRQTDIVGVVSSAGGPQALMTLLSTLSHSLPPILLVQHISAGFATGFASWLTRTTGYDAQVATDGERAREGVLYVAPDDHHLWARPDFTLVVDDGPPREGFRPSGDLLLERLTEAFGERAVGVVLSGMGADGREGARRMRERGSPVVVQADPLINGMPQAASPFGIPLPVARIGTWLSERSGLS